MEKGSPLLWELWRGSQRDQRSLPTFRLRQLEQPQQQPGACCAGPCLGTRKARKRINDTLIKCNLLLFSLCPPRCQCTGLNCLRRLSPYSVTTLRAGHGVCTFMEHQQDVLVRLWPWGFQIYCGVHAQG